MYSCAAEPTEGLTSLGRDAPMTVHGSTPCRDHTTTGLAGQAARDISEAICPPHSGTFALASAACSTQPEQLDWVPDRERSTVPTVMAQLCRQCPVRQQCLRWALAGQEHGYWAATTSADRRTMIALGQTSVQAADSLQQLQQMTHHDPDAAALHPQGQGSTYWYRRRGCRCRECQTANSTARARERAKTRRKTTRAA